MAEKSREGDHKDETTGLTLSSDPGQVFLPFEALVSLSVRAGGKNNSPGES